LGDAIHQLDHLGLPAVLHLPGVRRGRDLGILQVIAIGGNGDDYADNPHDHVCYVRGKEEGIWISGYVESA